MLDTAQPSAGVTNLHLPPQLTRFIGREVELAEVAGLVARGDRLFSLTGPAGSGKTRLAIEVAHRVAGSFPGGVWFVPLSAVADSQLVLAVIAAVLGVRDAAGEELESRVRQFISGRSVLLVLDSLEHLPGTATTVDQLLAASPSLTILVTSRGPLRSLGEHVHEVPPLATPDPTHLPPIDELASYEAISLFIDRARTAQPGFQLDVSNARAIAEICRQVDSLPLAIELAASRVGSFPPDVLLGQLARSLEPLSRGGRVRPGRQQTLTGAINWSYRLLDEDDQTLLARLGVLCGSWTAEAAEAVGSAGGVTDLSAALASLASQSLVRVSPDGFSMLKTVRQFALERLAERGEEDAIKERHARYFMVLAARADPELRGAEQIAWFHRLERGIDNFRAAMSWLLEQDRVEEELRLAADLYGFWFRRGHWSEGLRWLEAGLAGGAPTPQVRIRALQANGDLLNWFGRYEDATARLHEALSLAEDADDVIGSARALRTLSTIARWRGDLDDAESFAARSLALYEHTDDLSGRAIALNALGVVAYLREEYAQARERFSEALACWNAVNDRFSAVWAMNNLGLVAMEQGHLEEARTALQQSLQYGREVGQPSSFVTSLSNLGDLCIRLGEYHAASAYLDEGIRLAQDLGYTAMLLNMLTYTVEWLGAQERGSTAASLSGAVRSIREARRLPTSAVDTHRWELALEQAAAQLGPEGFRSAHIAARSMEIAETVEYALRELETPALRT